MNEVKAFVDAVFELYPEEAPKMARMALSGKMGFGARATDYGDLATGRL